jgi:hypothetical protein
VISSLPNANLADALGRLPRVSLERDEGEGKYVQVRGTEPRLTNATETLSPTAVVERRWRKFAVAGVWCSSGQV